MNTYSAAIIGYGRMARGHLNGYKEAGIPVVAAADISEEALGRFRGDTGTEQTYTDYRGMLDEVRPDLISIVTHDRLHCTMVVDAAERGVSGIICEKPMAMNLEEADRMLDACRGCGAKLTVSHQRYYMPQYAQARELIAEGAIGKIRSAEAYLLPSCIHTDGTHTIHMLLSLLGNPRVSHLLAQVDAHSGHVYYDHRVEDAGVAFIAFDNQVYAQLSWGLASREPRTSLSPVQNFRYHRFVICGDTGRLELDGDAPVGETPILRIVRGAAIEAVALSPRKGAITLEIEDLVRSVETNVPHPLDGQNGRDVLEVIMAIYESARRRCVIQFPLAVKDNPFLAMCETGEFPP
ncbi:MAG: Gfo/Idh/MocA family oxidoreductase [Candidatus Poribacteria bacterium]|nr:Gfo/Idh/MocA family oxidoreductase [Candidatus Poribacteria bacterium]